MADFTVGPWEVVTTASKRVIVRAVSGPNVCSLDVTAREYGREAANAAAIAAMPDLHKACQRVADAERVLGPLLDRAVPGWRSDYLFGEMFAEVRAAIAKAEGNDDA